MTKRFVSIDIARAICIILVVVGHYLPENSPDWYVTINRVIYAFHMPLFMFISGYLYWATRKPLKYKDFVWKKFQRLMIPYFFTSVVIIIIKLLTEKGLSVQNPVTYSAFYEMFYLPIAGFFLWFVYVLFLIFLIIPFFNTRKRLFLLCFLSLALYYYPTPFPQICCFAQLKSNLLYFVLGCVSFEWINIRKVLESTNFLVALSVFAGIYILRDCIDIIKIKIVANICIAFAGIVFILNFSKYIESKTVFTKNTLLNISAYSYTIYLFHTTFEGFIKAILLQLPLSTINNHIQMIFILNALIVISCGVVAPIILHKIIVRNSRLFSYIIGANYIGKKNRILPLDK